MITVSHLTKTFRTAVPKEGRFAAFRSLFYREYTAKRAVDDVSFTVGDGEMVGSNLLLALSEKGYPIVDAGQLVPLWLFPESLRTFAQLLPFRSVYSIPLAIYIGRSSSAQMVQDLWFQLFWVVVLFSIGHFLWNRVHARLVVQGG